MKNSVEYLSETRVKLAVEVTAEEFAPEYEKAAKTLAKQVNIPGFRPGHAPRRILEAKIGKGYIIEQAINDGMDKYYQQAVAEADVFPMSRPEIAIDEVPEMKGKGDTTALKFTVEVDVRPEIILADPATLTVKVASVEVSDADVDAELDALRERFATLNTVERAAAKGDHVTIDMVATIDGEEIDDVAGISYKIGEGNMLAGQDEALTGAKAGDEVEFTAKLMGGAHEGEEAQVKITVHTVKESVLPEADDEFAQLASEFDTLDELKEDLRKAAGKNKGNDAVAEGTQKLADALLEAVQFPLPESVVAEEVKNHLEREGKEADDAHGEEIRGEVEGALRTQLLLDAYAKAFNVDVAQDELIEFLVSQAQMYGMDPNQFIQAAAQTNQIGAFAGEIARNKGLIAALRLAKVEDENGTVIDVTDILGEAPEGETVPDFSAQEKKVKVVAKSEKKADKVEEKAEATAEAGEFDPSAHKVDEVIAYIESADDAEKARVLDAEKAGKARKTIMALAD
ncbi:trigger factor [Arcanobacterium haemolyticum]|uniref:Trigger factor n=1 Tax=Arcanobacterium haemolyticum (strain ATCC 9345 / DSM 20595 / CCM 5947 / CCUG 17215 / LMG 16163 / NBRC 15585 / NCTC 8452 / 11018) TaxID=644284 RepID=D7BMY3_ARCHD|nr:trigger factor [Arcanobacterium haemolyticum]ADH92282.1 trigger factor [Arcanobacterium haemolyticum DSM 20595]QCX46418.1 trigger factor [Arcanobacterium haemolyticum]SQH28999.1 Trigger factor [Arcanobacterium haemolyticum]